jgi:TolB-like protein
MADVFLSYSQKDREAVERIANGLKALGLSVWYDGRLDAGSSFDEEISAELRDARSVLVCWSPNSIAARWPRAEAMFGYDKHKLAACFLHLCELTPPFNLVHTSDLSEWGGDHAHKGWRTLTRSLGKLCGRPAVGALAEALAVGSQEAVSSWSENFPEEALSREIWASREAQLRQEYAASLDGTKVEPGNSIEKRRLAGGAALDPGGVCLSQAPADIGDRELKNIVRPVRMFRVRADAGAGGSPSQAAPPVATPSLPLPEKPSIAVLPFATMSGDPEQEYFADGMVEEIITALSRVRSFFVIARNSSFTYKGKPIDVKQVGRELGVRYILEGGVRKAGNRVRITCQLINAPSAHHVWADRFEATLDDIFDLQDRKSPRASSERLSRAYSWQRLSALPRNQPRTSLPMIFTSDRSPLPTH